MNSKNLLLAATLAGGLLCSATVSSAAVVLSDLTVNSTALTAPAPVKVVAPTGIPRHFEGQVVRLGLVVDETGRPHKITLLAGPDPDLIRHLLPVVAQWRFSPAMKNGRAVAAKVELPVELVELRPI